MTQIVPCIFLLPFLLSQMGDNHRWKDKPGFRGCFGVGEYWWIKDRRINKNFPVPMGEGCHGWYSHTFIRDVLHCDFVFAFYMGITVAGPGEHGTAWWCNQLSHAESAWWRRKLPCRLPYTHPLLHQEAQYLYRTIWNYFIKAIGTMRRNILCMKK